MTAAPAAAEATPARSARRARILDAAVELADGGGWHAVQMRTVAEHAEVALGTLYRYFPSKTALLVSAMSRQLQELRGRVGPDEAGEPGERVYQVVAAVTRFVARNRKLSGAMLRALMSADATASEQVDESAGVMVEIISSAYRDPARRDAADALVAEVIGKVWLVDVVMLLAGRMSEREVLADLRRTIPMVLAAAPDAQRAATAGGPARPPSRT